MVAVRFPALLVTICSKLIPSPMNISFATLVGLISEAKDDLIAFAPSDALIPPSFIAVKYKARSSISPPKDLTTGPAFGIASTKSLRVVEVWFSTALRKLIDSANS